MSYRFRQRVIQNVVAAAAVLFLTNGFTLLAGTQSASSRTGARSEFNPKILGRAMVYAHPSADPYDPNNRYGFNHAASIVLLPDGRLLTAWFSGAYEAAVNQLILGSYSADQGENWSPAEVLQDFPRKSDFDPAFIADGQRTWFFFSAGRWIRWPFVKDEQTEVGLASYSTYYRHTDDSGRTWSAPRIASEKHFCRSNGIKLLTGELLLPVYETVGGRDHSGVLKSVDSGKTWKAFGDIVTPEDADEPSIAELKSGAVMMILRTHDGFLWKALSHDKGETWTLPQKTDIVAANTSHNLFRLKDGRLVLTNNESPRYRTPLTLRISSDDGANWSEPLILAEVPIPIEGDPVWERQVSYPSVAELSDGTIVVVWSELVLADTEQYGDIRSARIQLR